MRIGNTILRPKLKPMDGFPKPPSQPIFKMQEQALPTTIATRSLKFIFLSLFALFITNATFAQTVLLSDPGLTYGNSDGPTGPDVYSVNISTCTSVSFSMDYSFNQSWEGSGNMETADECPFGGIPCAGDPSTPSAPGCDGCWDFLWAVFNIDGASVGGDLIGETGTTNLEQSGSINSAPLCTNGASTADITVVTQTWAASEEVTFSNIMILCWEAAPTISSNSPLCVAGQDLDLMGSAVDVSAVQSWAWTNSGTGTIIDPSAQNTTATNPEDGETYTLTTTDPNGCTAEDMITVSVAAGGANASISGGGIICSGQCSDVNITITGGAPPYNLSAELDFPPFVNNWPFIIPTPDANSTMTICVDGVLPSYDPGTNTLTIPDFIGSNITITLTDLTDNSSCGAGSVDPTPLFFDIESAPNITTASLGLFLCDDGTGQADFDLTVFDNNIDVDGGNTVLWWSDMDGTIAIGNPSNYTSAGGTVYASVANANCESETIPVTLSVDPAPNAIPTTANACDDGTGQAIFDLTLLDDDVDPTGANTVNWYSDIDGTILIGNPTTYQSTGEVVYATVDNGVCESTTVGVLLTVIPPPTAISTTADACDDGTGQAIFDLTTLDNTVNGSSGNTVEWYTNPTGTISIPDPTSYITSGGTVYAVVNDGLCPSIPVDVTLTIVPGPTATAAFIDECDNGTGQAIFDLTTLETIVNGGLGYPVTWYTDPAGTDMILDPTTYLSGSTTVYASIFDGVCPSVPIDIILTVTPIPLALPTSVSACDDGTGQATFDLTTLDTDVDVNSLGFVIWSEDQAGNNLIGDPTNYTTGSTIVYASVFDGICSSPGVPVTLTVEPAPTAIGTTASECNNGMLGLGTFDLFNLETEVGNGDAVSWFLDPLAQSPINNPGDFTTSSTSVYATVSNGICTSDPVEVILIVNPNPFLAAASIICLPSNTDIEVAFTITGGASPYIVSGTGGTLIGDMFTSDPIPLNVNYSFLITDANGCITTLSGIQFVCNCATSAGTMESNLIEVCDPFTATAIHNGDEMTDPSDITMYYLHDGSSTTLGTVYDINNTGTFGFAPPLMYNEIYYISLVAGNDDGTGNIDPNDPCLSVSIGQPVIFYPEALDINEIYAGCSGDGYTYTAPNGSIYNEANPTDNLVLQDINGCDYNLTVNLVFTPATPDINETYNGCQGDGYFYTAPDGTVYNEGNPSGNEVLQDANSCDYNLVVNLTFNPSSPDINEVYNGCEGDGYFFTAPDGTVYNEGNPSGNGVLQDANGCDYNLSVTLTFNTSSPDINETYNGCAGDGYSFTAPDGTVYNEGNPSGNEILQDANGCNYNLDVNLTFNAASPDINETYNGCAGDGYSFTAPDGTVYNEGNPSGNEVLQDANGCNYNLDVNLTFNAVSPDISEVYNGCAGDGYSFTAPDGTVYNEGNPSGNELLQDANGCNYNLDVNLTFNATTPDISETYNGCAGDAYSFTAPDGTIYNESNQTGNEVLQDANGCNYNLDINLIFTTLPTANIASASACDEGGNQASFDLTTLDNTVSGGIGTVNWYSDDMGQFQIGNPTIFVTGSTSVYATVSNALCESLPVEIILIVNENPSFTNLTDDCLPSNTMYVVTFEITDGTAPYTVSGDPGTLTGTTFISDPITIGDSYTFSITDANGCGPIEVTGSNLQCDCASEAGTMDGELIEQCGGGIITAEHLGGEFLEGDDILLFILHDNPGNTPGFIYATNGTPEFDLDVIPGLMPNTTYYISAVVGNDNGTGDIDLTDVCLSVSQGTPFIIYAIPNADISATSGTICGGDNCLNFFILLGGSAPVNLEYTIDHPVDGIQSFSISTSETIYTIPVCSNGLQDGVITITLDSVSDTNCPGFIYNTLGTVTVIPTNSSTFIGPLCNGQEIDINGTIYNEANPTGVETFIGGAFNGCDSIVTVNLQFTDSVSGEELYTGCEGDGYSVDVNGNTYNETSPNGTETLMSSAGCDSIVTIDLDFLLEATGSELYIGCENDGYSVMVNGNTYNETSPSGTETIPSVNGCDSIITINLIFNTIAFGNEDYEGCEGDGYSVIVNGNTYDEATSTGVETLMTPAGCDSTVIVNLVFNEASTGEELHEGCIGDGYSIVVNGNTYDEASPNGTEVIPNAMGCDSTITIDLNFGNSVNGDELYNGCVGDGYSVVVNGNTYDEASPIGMETLVSGGGCDSIVSINLVFNTELTGEEVYQGCESDGYSVIVNGNTYNEATPTGSEILPSSLGCDSIVTITLVFNSNVTGQELHNGCTGDGYAVLVNGNIYNEASPNGIEILMSDVGCDSIVTIDLDFNNSISGNETYSGCIGDGYSVVVNGNTYDETTPTGMETIPSSSGCDSIVTITLEFNDVLSASETYTGCSGDGYSVMVNGNLYNEITPDGVETIINPGGCNSIVVIDLIFNTTSTGDEVYDGCFGDGYSVVVNGNIYNETTPNGIEIMPNSMGCDSTIIIDLNFSNSVAGSELYNGCIGDGYSVVVNGNTYDEGTPTGQETIPSTGGCDSIVTINLAFNISLSGSELYEGCTGDTYSVGVNGNTYNETSPTGMEIIPSSIGCDSIVTINLVFNAPSFGAVNYDGCESDGFAVLVNGTIYNEGNPDGSEVILNAAGCDSTILVDLNFGMAVTADEVYQGCENDGYSVMVGGTIYNEANPTGTETLMSDIGCDSIVTIDLSFSDAIQMNETYTGCENDGYSVTVNGNIYNETNATGIESMLSTTGCDSIVSISLTFNTASNESIAYNGCIGDGYSVTVNGTIYNEANPDGMETIIGGNHLGCDSIVNIDLAYNIEVTNSIIETICDADIILVNGTIYGLNNPMGVETIIGGSAGGCDSVITVDLSFHPQVLASLSQDVFICPGDSVPISFIFEGGTTYDVIFNNGTTNIPLNGISNGYTVMVSPTNTTTYTLTSVDAIGIPCDPQLPSSSVTIEVSNIGISAQVDSNFGGFSVGCNGSNDGIASANPINGNAPYTYQWSNGASGSSTNGLSAGVVSVTITDAIGCTAETQLVLTEPSNIQASLSAESPSCFGEDDGWITIDTVLGGGGTYAFSLDGQSYQSITGYPITIPFVEAGNFELYFQDMNDCINSVSINVTEPQQPALILGDDVEIILGDSVELNGLTNISVDEYNWNTTLFMSCDTCYNTFTSPTETINYSLTVIDTFGCSATDEITISVLKPRAVFIPNAFSPNGDGINDVFFINAGQEVQQVNTLRVFDRWGEIVFTLNEFQPNDPRMGWEGIFKGKRLNPGVFVFIAEIEFIDGHVEMYQGDITLMK